MRWIQQKLGAGVTTNVVSLYGAYLVNYAVPLITIPYLVRALGASSWGLVAMAQGLGNYLNLVVEYGFNLSATREVARNRDSQEEMVDLVTGVVAAKLLLGVLAVVVALAAQFAIPGFAEHPRVLWAGVSAGIALGLNPLWYFQGCERMKVVATLEVGAKIAASAGVFVFVHGPADAWRVPGLQAAASVVSTGVGLLMMYQVIHLRKMTVASVRRALATGWTMFLFRSSAMLYTSGNSFLLGLFAPPAVVGYFAGAEKISKAFMGLLNPFNQAVYPRLSRLARFDRQAGARLLRTNAIFVGVGGLLLGAAVFIAAPWLVRFLLGRELMPAVPVLRFLAVLPPLIGMNTVLLSQWMAPLGMDSTLNKLVLGAGVLNIGLACLLAPRYQAMGMAFAVVVAELFIGLAATWILMRVNTRQHMEAPVTFPVPDMDNPA